jgi:type IV fimbrial biogenesis protein FimT
MAAACRFGLASTRDTTIFGNMGSTIATHHSQSGFTLMELMIVLSVAAVVLAIGTPNFTEFSRNNRLTAAANDLLGAVQIARTEAIKRQRIVSLCSSANPENAAPSCSNASFRGWIIFEDADANCQRDGDNITLRSADPLSPTVHAAQDQHCASFDPNGYVHTSAGPPPLSHVVFCDDRGTALQPGTTQSAARAVTLSRTGRAAVTRDAATIIGWNLACPGA